ncbi:MULTISPECIES: uridine kinase [unclassified Oceanispirochaeta]|uniref:uridine kinase n=1 Tax=unclassified Oceanispirochaeta TaxID=2635722 RepID=UPI000E09CBC4|nr:MULTISPECIES: uridine kinase [unclassified Oceanispirochaeta]MBF9016052.1 uridine kinase [Oceanispirochaeta sp. M2]NPD72515.1 uridine kinase [Oceanispirochaeta sp. M1]RDG31973.1 uridine kinase [Oceanispirochaeta sp. M1]
MDAPKIIGISGGSGSGKTTIVRKISESIEDFVFIPQDNYYRSAEYITNSNITEFNFDHPNAFDKDLIMQHLADLKDGKAIQMPQYDFVHHRRMEETIEVKPKKVIIFEGIMVFYEKMIRDLMDLKIYVDTPDDIRFIRRLQRDVNERGRTQDSVIKQYMDVVRPGHFEFIEPTKSYADIIIPEGGMNMNALQVLAAFIKETVERD